MEPEHPVLCEYNFDGLVGPTHNYAGLSVGNVASMSHEGVASNPRLAALEGLRKMLFVHELGFGQAVLPPHERPSVSVLRSLGFAGASDEEVIARAAAHSELLLRLVSSASAMWTANAATVAPSCDALDGRLHVTPANLHALFHRSIEAETTRRVLGIIFADRSHFTVHDPLPGGAQFADEGAANHTRLSVDGASAVHVFAWGRSSFGDAPRARRFPARQTLEASQALARLHRLAKEHVVFAEQNPAGIDAGAFHTDVLGVGAGNVFLMHELAFLNGPSVLLEMGSRLGGELDAVVASDAELPIADAVASYAFNSQLLSSPDGRLVLLAPEESRENANARRFLERAASEVKRTLRIEYVGLRQSMQNGGGPACLRLRVPLTSRERDALGARCVFSRDLYDELVAWVRRHYRERLLPGDLRDPALARESFTALDELTKILALGSIYDFQRTA